MSETQVQKYTFGVGRRKRSTARAKYYSTTDELQLNVNKSPIKQYFPAFFEDVINTMLTNVGINQGKFDIYVNGGGQSGQAEAVRLAIAKALLKKDEGYRTVLRMYGYLTTDNRKVLPKQSGLRKARKREQWSKR